MTSIEFNMPQIEKIKFKDCRVGEFFLDSTSPHACLYLKISDDKINNSFMINTGKSRSYVCAFESDDTIISATADLKITPKYGIYNKGEIKQ